MADEKKTITAQDLQEALAAQKAMYERKLAGVESVVLHRQEELSSQRAAFEKELSHLLGQVEDSEAKLRQLQEFAMQRISEVTSNRSDCVARLCAMGFYYETCERFGIEPVGVEERGKAVAG